MGLFKLLMQRDEKWPWTVFLNCVGAKIIAFTDYFRTGINIFYLSGENRVGGEKLRIREKRELRKGKTTGFIFFLLNLFSIFSSNLALFLPNEKI